MCSLRRTRRRRRRWQGNSVANINRIPWQLAVQDNSASHGLINLETPYKYLRSWSYNAYQQVPQRRTKLAQDRHFHSANYLFIAFDTRGQPFHASLPLYPSTPCTPIRLVWVSILNQKFNLHKYDFF